MVAKDLSDKHWTKLSKKSFALPDERRYPIPDEAQARNTLARVAQIGTPAEQNKVRAAVHERPPASARSTRNP